VSIKLKQYHGPSFPTPSVQDDTIIKIKIVRLLEIGMLKPIRAIRMGIFIHNPKWANMPRITRSNMTPHKLLWAKTSSPKVLSTSEYVYYIATLKGF